jgi:hypothetical protein
MEVFQHVDSKSFDSHAFMLITVEVPCARDPLTLLAVFLRTSQAFTLLTSNEVTFSLVSTSSHLPRGRVYILSGSR